MNVFMIMCHKNPIQVIRFAKSIQSDNTDVIIHADRNMGEEDYNKLEEFVRAHGGGIYLTEKRLHGVLDDRSLVDIAMLMAMKAKENEKCLHVHYKYYGLCSGQDYLIKPRHHIEEQLESQYPKSLIDCTPWDKNNWVFVKSTALCKYHSWINHIKQRPLRAIFRGIEKVLYPFFHFMKCEPYEKLRKHNIKLYGGSAWWILPDTVMNYILSEYDRMPEWMGILLNNTATPEETFFQTVAMRSPYAGSIKVNPVDMVAQNCMTFAYFSDTGKSFNGHPYIITVEQMDILKKSNCYFARKFDENVDKDVFDAIDEKLLLK